MEEGQIEKFVGLDMSDGDTVFDRCLDACHKIKRELGDLDGVTCFCELAMPLASRLCERLGLATNSPQARKGTGSAWAARAQRGQHGQLRGACAAWACCGWWGSGLGCTAVGQGPWQRAGSAARAQRARLDVMGCPGQLTAAVAAAGALGCRLWMRRGTSTPRGR